jgi:hypothetical protein
LAKGDAMWFIRGLDAMTNEDEDDELSALRQK